MLDPTALFSMSYGLYVVSAADSEKRLEKLKADLLRAAGD